MQEEPLAKWILNAKKLECLKLNATTIVEEFINTAIPQLDFSSHIHLHNLHLEGLVTKMFDMQYFPTNLVELCP